MLCRSQRRAQLANNDLQIAKCSSSAGDTLTCATAYLHTQTFFQWTQCLWYAPQNRETIDGLCQQPSPIPHRKVGLYGWLCPTVGEKPGQCSQVGSIRSQLGLTKMLGTTMDTLHKNRIQDILILPSLTTVLHRPIEGLQLFPCVGLLFVRHTLKIIRQNLLSLVRPMGFWLLHRWRYNSGQVRLFCARNTICGNIFLFQFFAIPNLHHGMTLQTAVVEGCK